MDFENSYTPYLSEEKLKYLRLLSEKYPTIPAVCREIINLKAILNLPKGTEHFMSDLHGEYEAFYHILKLFPETADLHLFFCAFPSVSVYIRSVGKFLASGDGSVG